MYPMLDSYTDPMPKGPGSIQGPIMYVFNELHCGEEADLPVVSPVFASEEELKGLPKAIICYADNDCLKHEGKNTPGCSEMQGLRYMTCLRRGCRIYCAIRTKTYKSQEQSPLPQAIFMGLRRNYEGTE